MMTSLLIREDTVREALREVIDPELGESLVDLGLIYAIRVDGSRVNVDLTLTTPSCPLHASLHAAAERAIRADGPRRCRRWRSIWCSSRAGHRSG